MIISNHIEHLRTLSTQLKYDEVIQFATITLHIAIPEKRYEEALNCFEYLACAHHEKGDFENFCLVMVEYEKLCLIYGNDSNKMMYYYLLSLLNTIARKYDASIQAAKSAIRYANALKNDEMVAINFANMAAQLIFTGEKDRAVMAARFAIYYKEKLLELSNSMIRSQIGMLYFSAIVNNVEQYNLIKDEIKEMSLDNYFIYEGHIALSEAILTNLSGNSTKAMELMEIAYYKFKEQNNCIHLLTIYRLLNRLELTEKFIYFEELSAFMKEQDYKILYFTDIKNIQSDIFHNEIAHSMTFKYPNIISKELIEQHVNEALVTNEQMFCLHWCFIIDEIEELFGSLFVEQLLFRLFETIYLGVAKFNAEFLVHSKIEGEAIISIIDEKAFFELIMELELKLQSASVQSTKGRMDIPIHFGFSSSDEIVNEQPTYEAMTALADARLYYAKSQGQLFIYS